MLRTNAVAVSPMATSIQEQIQKGKSICSVIELIRSGYNVRDIVKALYNQVKGLSDNTSEALVVPAKAGDPVVQALRTEEIKIEKEIIEMSKKFGEKHPKMMRLREDLGRSEKR